MQEGATDANQGNNYEFPHSICKFIEFIDDNKDLWIVYELIDNATSLFGCVNEIQGGFHNGERIYEVVQDTQHLDILESNNCYWFKYVLIQIL